MHWSMWHLVAGGLLLGPNRWNFLQRVGMFTLPTEVRVIFSALTACGASAMNKARHSSGTCPSAANESEPIVAPDQHSCSKGLGWCP